MFCQSVKECQMVVFHVLLQSEVWTWEYNKSGMHLRFFVPELGNGEFDCGNLTPKQAQ